MMHENDMRDHIYLLTNRIYLLQINLGRPVIHVACLHAFGKKTSVLGVARGHASLKDKSHRRTLTMCIQSPTSGYFDMRSAMGRGYGYVWLAALQHHTHFWTTYAVFSAIGPLLH